MLIKTLSRKRRKNAAYIKIFNIGAYTNIMCLVIQLNCIIYIKTFIGACFPLSVILLG